MKVSAGKLRYLGVSVLAGRREYSFVIRDEEERRFTLVVCDADFASKRISFQEAPDLCYQKLEAALKADDSVEGPVLVTAEDVIRYREGHQRSKTIRGGWSR